MPPHTYPASTWSLQGATVAAPRKGAAAQDGKAAAGSSSDDGDAEDAAVQGGSDTMEGHSDDADVSAAEVRAE